MSINLILIFANKFFIPLRYICIKGKQIDKKSQLLFRFQNDVVLKEKEKKLDNLK
jgi:hypothetical protein